MGVTEKELGKSKVSVALKGDMTIYSIKEVKNQMSKYLKNIRNMEIDLSQVNTIDTSGFQFLATVRKELESKDKTFNILKPSKDVTRIFSLYGENIP